MKRPKQPARPAELSTHSRVGMLAAQVSSLVADLNATLDALEVEGVTAALAPPLQSHHREFGCPVRRVRIDLGFGVQS